MSGWLFAGAALAAFALYTIHFNRSLARRQRMSADNRPPMDRAAFIREIADPHISEEVAAAVHEELSAYCIGADLHPSDRLAEFLEIDADELCFVCERLLAKLHLPVPPGEESGQWFPTTVRELAWQVQDWRNRVAGA